MTARSVVIAGAGIIGCMIARELAAADPDAMITVLDRDLAGSGATRRSAGLSLVKGVTPLTRHWSAASHRYYLDLIASHPGLPTYPVRAKVLLEAGESPAGAGYLTATADPAGADASGRQYWKLDGCHCTDVYALTQALAAQARPRVRFLESARITGLTPARGAVTLRTSSGDLLVADQVVLAPGPWVNEPAWRDLVSPLGLRVKKIVAMHLERQPRQDDELLIFDKEDAFLAPLAHRGHWLFSYTRLEWDVEPEVIATAPGLTSDDVDEAQACLRPHDPALAAELRSGRVCCDAYSQTREPVVAPLDPDGLIVFAGAAGGSGYRLAPAIARQAVGLLRQARYDLQTQGAADDHQHI
ncbi:MAG TPA: FAD-dependent oxidoreductase [Streptosporangiaceae bacterium]|nr:FAD-dependent oxidoreductase [Streptosporangiaceae bacterium]